MPSPAIDYCLFPANPAAHRFEVRCTVPQPDPAGQSFALPAWIPGSYLIRDFARHIIAIRAESEGRPVNLTQHDKHTWQAAPTPPGAPLTVICEIHAWDLSVRGAHLDSTHGFFNGSSVFLRVTGQENHPCRVDIRPPEGAAYRDWRIATALEPAHGEPSAARRRTNVLTFGRYRAANYDELIDHPVEMGTFVLRRFTACGIPHDIALTGRQDADLDRLAADLQRVCEWHIRFFGEPAPMKRYVFLVTAVGEGYGGLEHRASTALLCARNDLPHAGERDLSEGYRRFLGLASHEYFHTWNVKRIQPAAFTPYDLNRENYTRLLWLFEGFTSYYDDLALLRCGLIKEKDWLEIIAKTISRVRRDPGRLRQSLAESSFTAWNKFYRPDENTPNAVVSYYAKGALVALALDLTLRQKTCGKVSLDTLMRALWAHYGKTGTGVGENDLLPLIETLSGLSLRRFFADFIDGTAELPLARLLAPFGIRLEWTAPPLPDLGVKTREDGNEIRLATVYDGGPAQTAGLASGDLLVAFDGLRITPKTFDPLLARRQPGETVTLHAFRRDELMVFPVCLGEPAKTTATLRAEPKRARRRGWPEY